MVNWDIPFHNDGYVVTSQNAESFAVYQSDIAQATIPQVDPDYITLGVDTESAGAEGLWLDYAPKYYDNQIDISLTNVTETGQLTPGISPTDFTFSVNPDQTGEITGLNDVNFEFPAGFKAYIDDYFIYDNSMMDPDNYQSLEFDVDLEVDLNGDGTIDVETERASGTFQIGESFMDNGTTSFWGSLNDLTFGPQFRVESASADFTVNGQIVIEVSNPIGSNAVKWLSY